MARGKARNNVKEGDKDSAKTTGPPSSFPQENFPEHRAFLMRSLERNDVDLAALTELNRSLHKAKRYILSTCGELILLDLGQGRLTLINDELHDNKNWGAITTTTENGGPQQSSDSPSSKDEGQEELGYSLTPKQKELCVDFLLRMKLRKKLLNRLARRLNRLAHAMDGEDVAPPAPPKYGDLRLHIDPMAVQAHVERWERQQEAKQALFQVKDQQMQVHEQEREKLREKLLQQEVEKKKKREQEESVKSEVVKQEQDEANVVVQQGDSNDGLTKMPDDTSSSDAVPLDSTDGVAEDPQKPENQAESHTTSSPDLVASQAPKPDNAVSVLSLSTTPVEPAASLLTLEMQMMLREYDDCYAKQWDLNKGELSASSSTVKYTILDQTQEEDHNIIKFGAGIGATNSSMSAKERELDYKRWQTAILSRIPEQPTFYDLGMQHRVFCLGERRKRAMDDVEESPTKKPKSSSSDDEDDQEGDENDDTGVKKKLDMDSSMDDKADDDKEGKDEIQPKRIKDETMDDSADSEKTKPDVETSIDKERDPEEPNKDLADKMSRDKDADDKDELKGGKVDNDCVDGEKTKAARMTDKDEDNDQMDESSDDEAEAAHKTKKEDGESDETSSSDMFAADCDSDEGDTVQISKLSAKKGEEGSSDEEDSDGEPSSKEKKSLLKGVDGDEKKPVVEKIKIQPRKEFLKSGGDDEKGASGGNPQNGGSDKKEKKKEDEKLTEPKRIKVMSLAPVPSFHEQDLKRIRMIHEDLMAASRQEHNRRRLSESTLEYNKAFRHSNEIYDGRQACQQQLTNFLYESRTKMSKVKNDYALEVAIARNRWQKKKHEHDVQQAKNSMPSNWGNQPVGTNATLNYIRTPGIPSVIGQCVADLVDGAILRLEGKVKTVKFDDFVQPPVPDFVNQQTGESMGQQHLRIETELRQTLQAFNVRFQDSEEERKKAWKKMLKTKAEFEAPSMNQLGHGQHGNARRTNSLQVDLSNYHLVPFPALRTSTQHILPQELSVARASMAAYTPPRTMMGGTMGGPEGPGDSDSKYSAARVRERISADGTVAPVSEPKKTKDGLYQRPAGRTRKGMQWDALKGIWVPE